MQPKRALFFFAFIFLTSLTLTAFADSETRFGTSMREEPGYFNNLARNWGRGLTNIVSSPLEIPVTIAQYHKEDPNPPGIKHAAGLTDGVLRVVTRALSGVWDLVVSVIPGDQDGALMNPPTLFEKTID